MDVRSDAQSSVIQKAQTVGYLVNIALRALELGPIEQRIEQVEATVNTEALRVFHHILYVRDPHCEARKGFGMMPEGEI
ncbi:MAG: hypothetical protein ACXV5F_06535 [Halobacteriota archaeon]